MASLALDVFDELRREMWNFRRQSLVPLVTVSETESTVIVEVDLPLVRKEDIQVRLVSEGLEVRASLRRCLRFENWGTVQRSCEFSSFYRVIALPSPVVEEGAKATFRKGILRVVLQKRHAVEHAIPIG